MKRNLAVILPAIVVMALCAAPSWAATDLACPGHGALTAGRTVAGDAPAVAADYADQVKIHLDGGAGTITLPDIMVPSPVLPYARKKALWPLGDILTSDERIEADIVFDVVRRSHLRIDRTNGNLSISGYDSFTGICTPYDPAEVKKLF